MDPYDSTTSDEEIERHDEESYYPPAFTLDDTDTARHYGQQVLNSMWSFHSSCEGESSRGRRGSVLGRKVVDRDRAGGHARLVKDYFTNDPVFDHIFFRRRFRMSRPLFLRILQSVEAHDPYFVQRPNAAGTLGCSALQKVTAAIRMLAYGVSADSIDEYIRIGESTSLESLKHFCRAVVEVFGEEYLRAPNQADTAKLLAVAEERGFPGMLGSIDCMHWEWKNCPTAWQGQFRGHVKKPTIILEAVASHDLWIWHAFFGMPGSHNDINVLHRSNIFARLAEGQAPPVHYTVNGREYNMGYYLADGIYPDWATFVKTIPSPRGQKRRAFAKAQESYRKDVERAFAALQSRFAIVRGAARVWHERTLNDIMTTAVVLHNMIVEDERDCGTADYAYEGMGTPVEPSHEHTPEFTEFIHNHLAIRNRHVHRHLQEDLVEHYWALRGEDE